MEHRGRCGGRENEYGGDDPAGCRHPRRGDRREELLQVDGPIPMTASTRFTALLSLAVALGAWHGAHAEDIDIYGRPPSANDLPNVLIVWDSSANWSANISGPNCYFTEEGVVSSSGPKATAPDKEQGTKFAIEK